MVVVCKNDRNVSEFKLYCHLWLLISTISDPQSDEVELNHCFLSSITRVNFLYHADSLFEASRLQISSETDQSGELTLVVE